MGVMPQNLDQITAAATKDEEVAAIGVTPQDFLDLQGQAVHPTAHVGVAGGEPDPHPAREGDHRPTSARSAAVTVVGSGAPEIRTRPPSGSSISISPEIVDAPGRAFIPEVVGGGVEGAIMTAAKSGGVDAAG